MSLLRPVMLNQPSASRTPMSPVRNQPSSSVNGEPDAAPTYPAPTA